MKVLIFNIPRSQSIKQVKSFLKQYLLLQLQSSNLVTRTYLDTFDWRIFDDGGVLEVTANKTGIWINWRSLGGEKIYGKYPIEQIPRFVWNLKETSFRSRLEIILGVRALLPVAIVYSRIHSLSVINNQGKTVLHVEFQSDRVPYKSSVSKRSKCSAEIGKRVHLLPMKGYEKILKKTCELLQQECNLSPVTTDPFVTTLERIGRKPRGSFHKPTVTDPEQRTDIAAKSIFYHLLNIMEQNEDGIRDDIDSEFLHDFRVALRRTRTLLGQMKGVFPGRRITRFSREFAWLGEVTGPTRDMDVYLLSFDTYKQRLPPEIRGNLIPLYEYLCRHRLKEHSHLIRALSSVHYQKLKQDWKNFLSATPPKESRLTYINHPIINVASECIWHIYRKIIKKGNVIGPDSPPTSLHQLRKTCKKLRYLIEFFQEFYPENKIKKLIKNLKDLQDILGEFQDLQVQQESLRKFILAMEQETGITTGTRNAMEMLIAERARQNRRVRAEFDDRFRKFASPSNLALYKKIIASKRILHTGEK
ncbi:MAG: hypothetical protein HW411_743 [Gammaproteobacteria bacterium]|nr:hypothetical protein [Gammaproteobacteria bacterium]